MRLSQVGWEIATGPPQATVSALLRKVRTPQSKMSGNSRGEATCRTGPQKYVAVIFLMGQ